MSDQATLIQLLRDRSLQTGDFVLASGQRSNYYIDARPTTMSAQGQQIIGRLGLAAIRGAGWRPEAVAQERILAPLAGERQERFLDCLRALAGPSPEPGE